MPEYVFSVSTPLNLAILIRPCCASQPYGLCRAALLGRRDGSVVHQIYAISYDALQSVIQQYLASLLESCLSLLCFHVYMWRPYVRVGNSSSYHYHRYIVKTNMPHTTQPSPADAVIRPATLADIDNLVEVCKTSAPLEEIFHYQNQHAQQYPEDLIKHETLVHHLLISPKYSDYHVMVAEAPSLEDVTVNKVIAYAV